jgi:hypothetical protein
LPAIANDDDHRCNRQMVDRDRPHIATTSEDLRIRHGDEAVGGVPLIVKPVASRGLGRATYREQFQMTDVFGLTLELAGPLSQQLLGELARFSSRLPPSAEHGNLHLPADVGERLQSLGYIR